MSPLLALVAFQAATVDPAKDPALAKPITVHLALTPLRAVVAAMAKESGQPLDASGVVADWKATVLVKALPAGRTMEALADTLGLVWKLDNGTYRLSRPDGGAAAETAYLQTERAERQKASPLVTGPVTMPGLVGDTRPARPGRPGRPGRPDRMAGGGAAREPYVRFDPNLLAVESPETPPPTRLDPAVPTGESPFAKAAAAWPSLPKELAAEWNKPISTPQLPKSPWEGGLFSLGDLLTAWHDASGLPVVADAFRVPARSRAMSPAGAFEVLQAIAGAEGASMKLADGVARLRHPGFWRLREQEIGESAWGAIERGTPTVDALAAFASRLTPAQAASFRSLEAPLSKVRTDALRESYPALTLWSALPAPARRALLAGTPVGLATVQNATNAYLFALREAPYYKAGDPFDVLALDPRVIGIFAKPATNSMEIRLAGEQGNGVSYMIPLR